MQLSAPAALDDDTRASVRALAGRVEAEDGAPPLSDQALALLGSPVRHVVARDGDRVVGYAQVNGESLEMVGDSAALDPLLDEFAAAPHAIWAHGARSRLAPALSARGYTQVRGLLQLRRPLSELDPRPLPAGVDVAAFRVGADEDAWLQVNAAAFADHPEQGRWDASDLAAREREPWFDPAGFLLAWRAGTLLGYHWTKRHSDELGEVYVLGVSPAAQGTGLGGALLDRGLEWLRSAGCREVLLYVEEDNDAARALYAKAGFTEHDRDTQWRRPAVS